MLGGWWASKIFFTHKRGASSTFRLRFTLLSRTEVQSPWRFKLRKAPKEAVDPGFVSFSFFLEACPDLFLSRALPAAGCDSKLSLGSGMQSSELSRQSLAYPGPTEINLAWSVRVRKRWSLIMSRWGKSSIELAGPECCLIPAGGTRNGSVERAGFPSSSLLSSVGDQRFGDVRYVN